MYEIKQGVGFFTIVNRTTDNIADTRDEFMAALRLCRQMNREARELAAVARAFASPPHG